MKRIFTSFLLLILLSAATFAAIPDNLATEINEIITTMMKKNNIPGVAVLMYQNGEPHAYFFGVANREKKTPVTKKTIFELGSITKIFTSLLLAQQIDAGKMQLDDSVTYYLPNLSDSFEGISLANLATHTGGLPFELPKNIDDPSKLKNYLATWDITTPADKKWIYSNVGIGLLGNALTTKLHQDDNTLYRKALLAPLKMQLIAFTVPARYQHDVAEGYDEGNHPTKSSTNGLMRDAWGLKASADDMQHFLSAAIGLPGTPAKIFYPMRMTEASYLKIADNEQGLAWQVHELTRESARALLQEPKEPNFGPITVKEWYDKPTYHGDALIDKTGATNGFRAYVAVIPNKKAGIVILANHYVSNDVLVNTARKILFKVADVPIAHNAPEAE